MAARECWFGHSSTDVRNEFHLRAEHLPDLDIKVCMDHGQALLDRKAENLTMYQADPDRVAEAAVYLRDEQSSIIPERIKDSPGAERSLGLNPPGYDPGYDPDPGDLGR